MFIDALADAGTDTLKLVPFLFLTYVFMEWLEKKTGEKQTKALARAGKFGPLYGAAAGAVPQCGFSAAASSLYAGGVITLGTLLAVFLSTSDEMLPIMISNRTDTGVMVRIVLAKAVIGMITGFVTDALLKIVHTHFRSVRHIEDLCAAEHCGCEEEEGNIFKSALVHTVHITVFVFVISFVLTLATDHLGEHVVASFMQSHPVSGVLLMALIGLIPNCGASVAATELYLDGMISAAQMMAGLLTGAGVGLLVLFRTNRHLKENFVILAMLYIAGVFWGLMLELVL